MEIKQADANIMATFMPKDGYLFKRSCVSMSLVANGVEYPIKLTHESKAFSDFNFHKIIFTKMKHLLKQLLSFMYARQQECGIISLHLKTCSSFWV